MWINNITENWIFQQVMSRSFHQSSKQLFNLEGNLCRSYEIMNLTEQMFGVTKTPSEEKILLYVHEHPEFKKTFL